jgi:hypothetical protein
MPADHRVEFGQDLLRGHHTAFKILKACINRSQATFQIVQPIGDRTPRDGLRRAARDLGRPGEAFGQSLR